MSDKSTKSVLWIARRVDKKQILFRMYALTLVSVSASIKYFWSSFLCCKFSSFFKVDKSNVTSQMCLYT